MVDVRMFRNGTEAKCKVLLLDCSQASRAKTRRRALTFDMMDVGWFSFASLRFKAEIAANSELRFACAEGPGIHLEVGSCP